MCCSISVSDWSFLLFQLVEPPLQGCMCVNLTYICCVCLYVDCIKIIKSCIPRNRNINATPVPHCSTGVIRDSASSSLFLSIRDKTGLSAVCWDNGMYQCVGSCSHVCQWAVTCGKSWEFAEIFTPSSLHCFLAACKLCGGFKNLEVRLLISRNRGLVILERDRTTELVRLCFWTSLCRLQQCVFQD